MNYKKILFDDAKKHRLSKEEKNQIVEKIIDILKAMRLIQ